MLLALLCRYIPLRQWAFDDSHSPKYEKFKTDELPKIIPVPHKDWKHLTREYQRTHDGKILTAPLLEQVPVFLPAANCSVSPGMPCLLIFMDFCMDGWLQSGQPVLPSSPRQHEWSDAVALVGFAPAFPHSPQ